MTQETNFPEGVIENENKITRGHHKTIFYTPIYYNPKYTAQKGQGQLLHGYFRKFHSRI